MPIPNAKYKVALMIYLVDVGYMGEPVVVRFTIALVALEKVGRSLALPVA